MNNYSPLAINNSTCMNQHFKSATIVKVNNYITLPDYNFMIFTNMCTYLSFIIFFSNKTKHTKVKMLIALE